MWWWWISVLKKMTWIPYLAQKVLSCPVGGFAGIKIKQKKVQFLVRKQKLHEKFETNYC